MNEGDEVEVYFGNDRRIAAVTDVTGGEIVTIEFWKREGPWRAIVAMRWFLYDHGRWILAL
jgi:hypothetical protein